METILIIYILGVIISQGMLFGINTVNNEERSIFNFFTNIVVSLASWLLIGLLLGILFDRLLKYLTD